MDNTVDNLCFNFLKNKSENEAFKLILYLRTNNNFELGIKIGEVLSTMYPFSYGIHQEYSLCCYFDKKYRKSYEINQYILEMKGLKEDQATFTIFNQHFSINDISDDYIFYNKTIVENILNRKKKEFPLLTLTITTCKRFDLFEKTINSFLNCVDVDMIDYWFLIDDNSSEKDRQKMKELYPFFNFYFKTYEEKGHIKSMNIIRDKVLNKFRTPYMLHMEDDWKFFCKRNYIKDAMDVLEDNHSLGQCLFNKNYTEIESDIKVKGGDFKSTINNTRYYIHEWANTPEKIEKWMEKHGTEPSSYYWPHFSLRPSVLRTKIFRDIGEFNIHAPHFEMDYAYRYVEKGYISAFFEALYCIHTGRLTSQIHDDSVINAYKLNEEQQFTKKDTNKEEEKIITIDDFDLKIKTCVLNLDRRPDRYDLFVKNAKNNIDFLNWEKFSAVDGLVIESTTQLQRIFNNNDYNMKVGMVGCLMSHVKMYIEFLNSDYDIYCIFEDDIEFVPNFDKKFLHLYNQLKNVNWDLVYLGHHVRNLEDKDKEYNKDIFPTIEKCDVYKSFRKSLGGTTGYLITKNGCKKLLDFISDTGATNCIDTLQQKCANRFNLYYCTPHLIYSDCCRNNNQIIDTDIQTNYKSLTISFDEKINNELEFCEKNNINIENVSFDTCLQKLKMDEKGVIYCTELNDSNIQKLKNECSSRNVDFFTIEDRAIFIYNILEKFKRYFHSFKIDNEYSIEDCIF
jgi:GR25 family glycosyltransferase involved in LPS biosynthesis